MQYSSVEAKEEKGKRLKEKGGGAVEGGAPLPPFDGVGVGRSPASGTSRIGGVVGFIDQIG